MAITFVGSNTQFQYGATPISMSLPASNQNDLVIVFTACQNESKVVGPSTSGYALLTGKMHSTANCGMIAYYKFMGSTPDTLVQVPAAGATTPIAVIAMVFRGVNTTTPMDVAATTSEGTGTPNTVEIVPASDNCCTVVAAAAAVSDADVGSITTFLPSPTVQINAAGPITEYISAAAAYKIASGGAGVVIGVRSWTTWTSGSNVSLSIALRPQTSSTDFNTVTKANVTTTGKAVVQRELVGISKYRMIYTGRTVNIPDSSVEAIFVDKYRIIYTGKTVNPFDTFRAVTVDKGSVLYRGRTVTPREITFEDVPRYRTKGLGSGTLSVTR